MSEVDKEYQQFLDNIPRIENAHKVHLIMTQSFKTKVLSVDVDEEKKDDNIIWL